MEAINEWLPNLSDQLLYSCKTYLVIIHRIPASFDTSQDSTDVCEHLIDYNSDIFTRPSALLSAKFLDGKRGGMSQKAHRLLILHLANPMTANIWIDHHVAFDGHQICVPSATMLQLSPNGSPCTLMQG